MNANIMNARILGLTDDLRDKQLIDLLAWLVSSGLVKIADIKGWRKRNNLPVDRED